MLRIPSLQLLSDQADQIVINLPCKSTVADCVLALTPFIGAASLISIGSILLLTYRCLDLMNVVQHHRMEQFGPIVCTLNPTISIREDTVQARGNYEHPTFNAEVNIRYSRHGP
jgi:hypothetical protein